jgi:hypothetical protein
MTSINLTLAALVLTAIAVWWFGMTVWIVGILILIIFLAGGKDDAEWEMSSGRSKDR